MSKLLSRGEKPDHIIIETSGLALPQPLVRAFNWPDIKAQVTVDGVLTVVDGKALSEGRFADARAMWSDGGNASGRDPSAFAAAFAGVEGLELGLGEPGAKEGAAGSIYIEIPATLTGTGTGGPWRVEEPVILRRVNNVDGSTEEQRRWHIAKAPFPPDARE